jgi:flagellar protein FlaG
MVTQVGYNTSPGVVGDPRAARDHAPVRGPAEFAQPRSTSPGQPVEIPPIDAETLESAVKDIVADAQNRQRSLQFSVDKSSGRTIITVIDRETAEVIRQIPSEEVLTLAAQMRRGGGSLVAVEA